MTNTLRVLYTAKDQDQIFDFFKAHFGASASGVEVDTVLDDSLVELTWSNGTADHVLAQSLTEAFPAAVIETSSTTGMDLCSRFFNGTQLW